MRDQCMQGTTSPAWSRTKSLYVSSKDGADIPGDSPYSSMGESPQHCIIAVESPTTGSTLPEN